VDSETFPAWLEAEAGDLAVAGAGEAPGHPFVAGARALVEPPQGDDPWRLHPEALAAAAGRDEARDLEAIARSVLAWIRARAEEDAEIAEELAQEDALFELHARFRAGEATPAGWHRRGAALAPGVWAVDLDVFVEVVLAAADWDAYVGRTLPLHIEGESHSVDLPGDVSCEECWTLPEAGLFEPDPGVTETDLEAFAEDEEIPGRFGDLHVVPIVV
jgi:hypothetical protein